MTNQIENMNIKQMDIQGYPNMGKINCQRKRVSFGFSKRLLGPKNDGIRGLSELPRSAICNPLSARMPSLSYPLVAGRRNGIDLLSSSFEKSSDFWPEACQRYEKKTCHGQIPIPNDLVWIR